jgi:hypothetical protein
MDFQKKLKYIKSPTGGDLTEEEIAEERKKFFSLEGGGAGTYLKERELMDLCRDKKLKAVDDKKDLTKEEKERIKKEIIDDYASFDINYGKYVEKLQVDGGPFSYALVMDNDSQEMKQIDVLTKKIQAANPQFNEGNMGYNDVYRDVCRWTSPLHQSHHADEERCKLAYKHVKNVNDYKTCPPEQKVNVKGEALKSAGFLRGEMHDFTKEVKEDLKTLPSGLFGPYPSYADILKNLNEINEVYKKSQSMHNIAKLVKNNGLADDLDKASKLMFSNDLALIHAIMQNTQQLVGLGKQWDRKMIECAKKGENPPDNLPKVKTLEELYKSFGGV